MGCLGASLGAPWDALGLALGALGVFWGTWGTLKKLEKRDGSFPWVRGVTRDIGPITRHLISDPKPPEKLTVSGPEDQRDSGLGV